MECRHNNAVIELRGRIEAGEEFFAALSAVTVKWKAERDVVRDMYDGEDYFDAMDRFEEEN